MFGFSLVHVMLQLQRMKFIKNLTEQEGKYPTII